MKNNIKKILDKYFDGETTLAEEQTLRTYFSGTDVAEDLLPFQSLFQHFVEEKEVTLSSSFDAKFLEAIGETNNNNNSASNSQPEAKVRTMKVVSRRKTWLRAAAAIAFLLGAFVLTQNMLKSPVQTASRNWDSVAIQDQKAALEETTKALKFLAKAFNKSSKKAGKEMNKVGKATTVFR